MAGTTIGYETTFIMRPDTTDAAHKNLMEKLKGIIQTHGGELSTVEDWGRRRLAFPIQKETKGLYTYLLYTGNNSLVAELERNMRINEQVIRFLSVKLGSDFEAAKHKRRAMPNAPLPVMEGEGREYHRDHHRDHREHREHRERN
jgi:small subunit ribosomal protein S6